MKEGKVQVTVIGRAEKDPDPLVTVSAGNAYPARDGWRIDYEEVLGEDAADRIFTMLWIRPDALLLKRTGIIESTLRFREGLTQEADYKTPYGVMRLGLRTRSLAVKETESRLEIAADYAIRQGEEEEPRILRILIETLEI